MVDNCLLGLVLRFYPNGNIKSSEYYPPNSCGILEGTEMISFYENSKVKTWYAFNLNWEPQFYYSFSTEGDTIGYIKPTKQDSTIFEEVYFKAGQRAHSKRFKINERGERVYLLE